MVSFYYKRCKLETTDYEKIVVNEVKVSNNDPDEVADSSTPNKQEELATNSKVSDKSDSLIDKYISEFEDTAVRYWNLIRKATNYSAEHSKVENDLNVTKNDTESLKDQNVNGTDKATKNKQKFKCIAKNITNSTVGFVKLVNYSHLQEFLSNPGNKNVSSNENETSCVLVLFYASWCSFSSAIAPHYNALGRIFPQLDVFAIDSSSFKSLNTRYGIMGVPTVALFNRGNQVSVKLNDSEGNINGMVNFLLKFSGMIKIFFICKSVFI
ncbi:Thioredoxin domain-containing protein 15 [Nymphon striatum]|nr:Thioredoxin domain-containing protein 15 [Nymphon striatum]